MSYEESYHSHLHKRLLTDSDYYLFRSYYSKDHYWQYLPTEGTILEYGVGIGQNVFIEKERSVGVDISEFAREQCRQKGITTFASIEDAPKINGIMCIHVLEHLENPSGTLKEFYKKLPLDGSLLIVLPVHSKNKPCVRKEMEASQHLYAWTFSTINNLLISQGFTPTHNSFNYARGYSLFSKLPRSLAYFCIKTLGYFTCTKEMIIVAKKQS